ncbi:MAG: M48 family metallopeptidase [Bacteroidales bacterium]
MTASIVFVLIILFLTVEFLMERILDYLNTKKWSDEMPEEVKGIYDEQKYQKSQRYNKERHQFSSLVSVFFFLALLTMLFFDMFSWLDRHIHAYTTNPILVTLVFFAILGLANDLLGLPFSAYSTFVIEEKYGFNKTTVATFVLDRLKTWLLSALLGGGLLTLIVFLYLQTGELFWIMAWGAITLFSIIVTMFYSTLIVPLFNKQVPLESGSLRDSIENFAIGAGFRISDIFVMDGSKRSSRANAYFSGLGPKKRIVLYDTLIKEHTNEELVAILAHEIGHLKRKHILKSLAVSTLETGLLLFFFSRLVEAPELSMALGATQPAFHLSLLAFGILYSPISTLLGIVMNTISRNNEYQADRFAGEHYDAKHLMSALKKLSVNHLSNLRPHKAYVFVHYSHPPLLQRLDALNKLAE